MFDFAWDEIIALLVFAFAATWTPGPNNLLLANSGARFGFRASLPHIMGVALGFPAMLFCIALGLGELFQSQAWFRQGLRAAGAIVMAWICWRIMTIPFPDDAPQASQAKPWRFWQASAFQWINPKAWAMAVATATAYVKGRGLIQEAVLCAAPFLLVAFTSAPGWVLFGTLIRRFLSTRRRFRIYNVVMGSLMAASGLLLFIE